MGHFVANLSWADVEFLTWSLVMTLLVSRLLLRMTRKSFESFPRILIANGLSLLLCGIVYGALPGSGYDLHFFPDLGDAISELCLPQGIWFLLDIILEIPRLAKAEMKSGRL